MNLPYNTKLIDLSSLEKYEALLKEITSVNYMTGPLYMRDYLAGKELASTLYSKAVYWYEKAKDYSAKMRAVAFLDKSADVCSKKGIRPNDEARKQVSMMDADYLDARDAEAFWRATVEYLHEKVQAFQCAHDDAKKIYDQSKQFVGGASSAPSRGDTQ